MAEAPTKPQKWVPGLFSKQSAYDLWVESTGMLVYGGQYIQDIRTLELGYWAERECDGAILRLEGQGGILEAKVLEIPPGKTLPPFKFALDEVVYVAKGRGLTTIWGGHDKSKQTFEWGPRGLMLIPRNYSYQITNTSGTEPVRLLHYNAFPMTMAAIPNPGFFINNPALEPDMDLAEESEFFAEAKIVKGRGERLVWSGNFFPDLGVWDKLSRYETRGAGGHSVGLLFHGSPHTAHMSVFPPRTYKKTHRHGPGPFRPGAFLIIVSGEGHSIMWPWDNDSEKTVVRWQEGTVFPPPDKWWHGHFNVGSSPARYLALHPPGAFNTREATQLEIQYTEEEPWVREMFESELAKRGITSDMPPEVFTDPDYRWTYNDNYE